MWVTVPNGCETISIEQQQFNVEIRDSDGRGYLRVPNHFAQKILNIQGFAVATELPEGAPEDLPQADPLRDGAIAELTQHNATLKGEVADLRSDLQAAVAQITALVNENRALREERATLQQKIEELEEKE